MRKRPSKPYRFAAVENTAIDALPSILATGLLTKLIRARDGDEVTVEGLCKTHVEGREALTKAMRMLVDKAFVVKFKIQRAASEVVEEDAQLVVKRGGSWYTTFTVDSAGFTAEEVAVMLTDIYDEGNVKAHRVEPEHLDPKKNDIGWARPTNGMPSVGATRENAEPWPEGDSRPTYGSPTVGPPTVGHPAAHIRKKTVLSETENEDEMPLKGRSPMDVRRTSTSGSGPVEGEGGSAASGNTKPAPSKTTGSQKARHSRDELAIVDQVLGFLPPQILSSKVRLPVVADAILAAMSKDGRSVEEMGQRINARWANHGFADKAAAGTLENPVGAVIAMVRPLRRGDRYACADTRCEDGRNLDTGEACPLCEVRAADWKAAQHRQRAAAGDQPDRQGPAPVMPSQRAAGAPARPFTEDCSGPYCTRSIPAGTGSLCGDCLEQQEAEAVGTALAEQWAADESFTAQQAAAGARLVAEIEQEDGERAAREEAEAAAAKVERQRLAAEEDARLRAEFAAQHPDLAAFSSRGPAPF
ncbi:hypothetical protein [Streptomyces gardneri]|uniref:hypothetical protein n=1 Tax=Streptomyces gardneri TaxID=66892 RepID=UPI00368D2E1B